MFTIKKKKKLICCLSFFYEIFVSFSPGWGWVNFVSSDYAAPAELANYLILNMREVWR